MSDGVAERRIVFIDDEPDLLTLVSAWFRERGFRTRTFRLASEFLSNVDWLATPDCIVSDVCMPGCDGIELVTRLRDLGVSVPTVLMTGHGDVPMAVRAIKAGAFDLVEKPFDGPRILQAVLRAVNASELRRSPPPPAENFRASLAKLTDRQKQVLDLVVEGLTSKEIALELGMSHRTVEAHRAAVMDRLCVRSLAELIRVYLVAG